MSTYGFKAMLAPRCIAVVGASERAGSAGRAVLEGLREGGFAGPVHPVNPRHARVGGLRCYPEIGALPQSPDLVVIATPPQAVSEVVAAAGEAGAAAAVILSAHLGSGVDDPIAAARAAARGHGLRLVGPDSVGLSVPGNNLNATLLASPPKRGDLALISQSGTIASAIAEWAGRRDVGFSALVTLGRSADIDTADCLDHFATDGQTRAILLSLDTVRNARKFLSAARAAARSKPVVVLPVGRWRRRAADPETHSAALAPPEAVYEAAFRRAGLLAVHDLDAMFAAVAALGRIRPFSGKRLSIVSNGRGIGLIAADRLTEKGGALAEPDAALMEKLAPYRHSGSDNPFDLGIDARPEDFGAALAPLLADRASDAILTLHVPTARAAARPVARSITASVDAARREGRRKPVFAVSFGEDAEASARYAESRIPLFASEGDAVDGFLHLVRYREAQDDLMRTPGSLPRAFSPDAERARAIVSRALAAGQTWLDPGAVEGLLTAYGIPLMGCVLAPDGEAAATAAWPLIAQGRPVALKLISPDIVHKSDVGGVRLGLTSEAGVREAAARMIARARKIRPDARITGFSVQPMVPRGGRRELIAGISDDPTFGPVIVFGHGGTAAEVIDDRAIALPPLDLALAGDLIARTRIARRLQAYRDVPAADTAAIALVLVKLAQLAADLPEIRALDINPLLAGSEGVLGIDARVRIAPETGAGQTTWHPRFAIRPYPAEWERDLTLRDGRSVRVRPVRPEDEGLFAAFFAVADPEDVRLRFFAPVREFSHAFLARMTQLDYSRAIAFVALGTEPDGVGRMGARPTRPTPSHGGSGEAAAAQAPAPHPPPDPEVPEGSGGLGGGFQMPPREWEASFEAADAAPQDEGQGGRPEDDTAAREAMLGAVRLVSDANRDSGEFAIYVRADIQRCGLGEALMRQMIDWARAEGIGRIEGTILTENAPMLALCRRLGFSVHPNPDEAGIVTVVLAAGAARDDSGGPEGDECGVPMAEI